MQNCTKELTKASSSAMQHILIFTDWFIPAYKAGGPVKSIFNLITLLKNDFKFSVICSDRDLHDVKPFSNICRDCWIEQDGYDVIYLSPEKQTLVNFKKIISYKEPEWLYFNSLFSLRFTLLPLMAFKQLSLKDVKVLLAPRGMFGVGALQFKKYKKAAFLLFARWGRLFEGIVWHATSMQEKDEILKYFPKAECRIAENLPGLVGSSETTLAKAKEKGQAKMFFLSRISPKKNLLFALRLLLDIPLENKISFSIIGPIEDKEYWRQCKELIDQLQTKENINVEYIGPVPNNKLQEILADKHFMLLPTLNENYGHVIMESWLNGCPVIISNQTPWQNLSEQKLGWELPLKKQWLFVEAVQSACAMEQSDYISWSFNCISFSQNIAKSDKLLDRSRRLFDDDVHE